MLLALLACLVFVCIVFLKVDCGSMFEISAVFMMWFALFVCWCEWGILEEELSILAEPQPVNPNRPYPF